MATTDKKKKAKARKKRLNAMERFADGLISTQVDQIDEALEKINKRLKPYENLIEKKNTLMAARRALLGGNRSTGAGGTRMRQEDVVEYLKEHPGLGPTEIAEHFSVPYSNIAGHLYRGKDERFINKDGRWYVRDPEEGINTEDDIEEDDDE